MVEKIVSGAQTGADRVALDWAIFRDIPHGDCSAPRPLARLNKLH